MQLLIIFLLGVILALGIYIIRYLKQKREDDDEIDRLNLAISLIKQEDSKKLKKRKKINQPIQPRPVVDSLEEEEDEQDVKDLISIQSKDLLRKSKTKRKLTVAVNSDNVAAVPEIASAATVFDRPVVGFTISEPVITRSDMDAALTIIARLENNLSDCTRDSLKIQSDLRQELDASLEKVKLLEEENSRLKENEAGLSVKERQIFKEQALSLETLNKELQELKDEKSKALVTINNLQTDLQALKNTFEKKSKDWGSRLQNQQDSHNNQILVLSSQLEAVGRDWKRKVDALEADLSRERYDNNSKQIQYQLLEMQCQKSEKDAFHAKAMIKQVLEEMRATKSQNEKLKRQLSESFEFNVFAQH